MTRQRNDDKSTEFGLWTRGQLPDQKIDVISIDSIIRRTPNIMFTDNMLSPENAVACDSENLDYIWFAYDECKIMLLEEKRFNGKQSFPQRDTHGIIHQALEFACKSRLEFKRESPSKNGPIEYFGYHLIQFENTNPEDGWVKIDNIEVASEQLLAFLRFEWMPTND